MSAKKIDFIKVVDLDSNECFINPTHITCVRCQDSKRENSTWEIVLLGSIAVYVREKEARDVIDNITKIDFDFASNTCNFKAHTL
tara:strand:+ start:3904 stop:4158 length:255 start_codon:yes stop_codon:yes gene_type:complete